MSHTFVRPQCKTFAGVRVAIPRIGRPMLVAGLGFVILGLAGFADLVSSVPWIATLKDG